MFASFDLSLMKQVAEVVGKEGQAMSQLCTEGDGKSPPKIARCAHQRAREPKSNQHWENRTQNKVTKFMRSGEDILDAQMVV